MGGGKGAVCGANAEQAAASEVAALGEKLCGGAPDPAAAEEEDHGGAAVGGFPARRFFNEEHEFAVGDALVDDGVGGGAGRGGGSEEESEGGEAQTHTHIPHIDTCCNYLGHLCRSRERSRDFEETCLSE